MTTIASDLAGTQRSDFRLVPADSLGSPTTGQHRAGELWMDSASVVWVCKGGGTPGAWDLVGREIADADIAAHLAASDPHGQYLKTANLEYTHNQGSASATWTIDHNLGRYPAVNVISSTGYTVQGDVEYPTANRVVINFGYAFSGVAHLAG